MVSNWSILNIDTSDLRLIHMDLLEMLTLAWAVITKLCFSQLFGVNYVNIVLPLNMM